MKRDLYVKKGGAAVSTGTSTGDATLVTADAQAVAQLQQTVAALQTSVSALQAANTQLTTDLTAEKAKGKGPNTEGWITESGEWTAPVTGDYDLLLIGGGNGGYVYSATSAASQDVRGGNSGNRVEAIVHLTQGDTVSVSIGAGGAGSSTSFGATYGGHTSFGDLTTESGGSNFQAPIPVNTANVASSRSPGAGDGGGGAIFKGSDLSANDGRFWGGGGGASWKPDVGGLYGAGKQGAVRYRYYDPNKTTTPDTDQEETSPQNPSDGA